MSDGTAVADGDTLAAGDALSAMLTRLRLSSGVFTEAALCGNWAIDTSGQRMATFHLVQSGDCWLQHADGTARRLEAGDLVLFPRDAKHLITSGAEPDDAVVVNSAPPTVEGLPLTRMLCGYFEFRSRARWPLLDSLPEVLVLALGHDNGGASAQVLSALIDEASAQQPGRQIVLDQLVHVLFVHALRAYMSTAPLSGVLGALADPRIGRALRGLHGAPDQPWSVASLASEAGMSRAAFSKRFRALVGETPMSYVTGWRMQVAIDLLTAGDDAIAQIATAVGYQSEAAFRNAFRTVVGTPPGTLRRAVRDSQDAR